VRGMMDCSTVRRRASTRAAGSLIDIFASA
jgi:hypothetical protein